MDGCTRLKRKKKKIRRKNSRSSCLPSEAQLFKVSKHSSVSTAKLRGKRRFVGEKCRTPTRHHIFYVLAFRGLSAPSHWEESLAGNVVIL